MTTRLPLDGTPKDSAGKDPYISEFGLLAYIAAAEKQTGPVYLMNLYNAGLAHPWRMTQLLEEMVDCKLIDMGPNGAAALKALQPALERVRTLEGPLLKKATPELVRAAAQRGVQMKAGEEYTDAGMAVISFNRAAGQILHQGNNIQFVYTPVALTDVGRAVLKARGVDGGVTPPKPRPFGG